MKCSQADKFLNFRRLARNDLFFLLVTCLGRHDAWHQWVLDRCKEVQANPNGHLDLWAREHYKDLSCSTPVLTHNRGWVSHGALVAGDTVFGEKGQPVKVLAITPHYHDSECWKITFDDGAEVIAGGGHKWVVQKKSRRRIKGTNKRHKHDTMVMTTAELASHGHGQDNRFSVRATSPLFFDNDIDIDPYALGCWLGDGCKGSGVITCEDQGVWDRLGARHGLSHDHTPRENAQRRTVYGLVQKLRKMGVLDNKHIPWSCKQASESDRRSLLQGLMDTDGHCNTRGTAYFNQKNKRLARDLWDLAQGLGLKPGWSEYEADHGTVWQVRFQAYKSGQLFGLKRKMDRCKDGKHEPRRFIHGIERVPTVPTNCIQVEDDIYLCGEHLIPTHNSTVITFALTIQDILRTHGDDAEGREATFGIFSHTRPDAKKPLRQIKNEFESNELLKHLFPDVLFDNPKKESPKWSEDEGIVVRRKSNPKEATVEAWGLIDGMPTGAHFTHRVYDDVVTEKAVTTPEMIQKSINAWELSLNLGVDGGVERGIGTRYDDMDCYRAIIDRQFWIPRIYPATHDGTADGEPVMMSKGYLEDKRKGMSAYNFSCQMLVNPIPDENAFFKMVEIPTPDHPIATLNYYDTIPKDDFNEVAVTWYGTTDGATTKDGGDRTVHIVFGVDHVSNIYIDYVWREQEDSDVWVEEQSRLAKKYNTVKWIGEAGPIEKAVGPFRNRMMNDTGNYYTYETLPSIGDKEMRASSTQARWNQGKVYIKRDQPWTMDFILELKRFPFTTVDDQVDAFGLIGRALDQLINARPPAVKEKPRALTFDDYEKANRYNKRKKKRVKYTMGAGYAKR